ncbi:uncharacterized protein LOC124125256 [Haliotis rufescens]|uniref:uncharacterized protein LOC124125256 n=1 Tax=Haliotis rufescens TaxID=6454 RepID=UPI001EAFB685|nr:uncharacterized protein LOC124125256 [Haliotis rufescens]
MAACLRVLTTLVLLLALSTSTSGWFFRRIKLHDTKNCFCKAVNNHNYGQVLKDFGSIQHSRCFVHCSCSSKALITCGTECDRKVKEWACDHGCGGLSAGTKVRASYKASVCNTGIAADVYVCGQQNNCHRG